MSSLMLPSAATQVARGQLHCAVRGARERCRLEPAAERHCSTPTSRRHRHSPAWPGVGREMPQRCPPRGRPRCMHVGSACGAMCADSDSPVDGSIGQRRLVHVLSFASDGVPRPRGEVDSRRRSSTRRARAECAGPASASASSRRRGRAPTRPHRTVPTPRGRARRSAARSSPARSAAPPALPPPPHLRGASRAPRCPCFLFAGGRGHL